MTERRRTHDFTPRRRHATAALRALLLCAVIAGCATPRAPVTHREDPVPATRAGQYVVQRGDTLFGIAYRLGMDYRVLARINGIGAPYTIYPGQKLETRSARAGGAERAEPTPARPAPPVASPAKEPPRQAWRWPQDGAVSRGYGDGNKGLDFELGSGAPIRSAAPGEVVYAGTGLRGFGMLVILRHSPRLLSAYASNAQIRVKEGENVKAGTVLAETTQAGTLHFEIRLDGQPVDPRRWLPGR